MFYISNKSVGTAVCEDFILVVMADPLPTEMRCLSEPFKDLIALNENAVYSLAHPPQGSHAIQRMHVLEEKPSDMVANHAANDVLSTTSKV